jgi:hypothetical protein
MEDSSYVEINVKKCNNSTSKSSSLYKEEKNFKCFSNEIIDKWLEVNELSVEWYFQNRDFNLSSFDNYDIKDIGFYYFDLFSDITKINIFSFSKNIYYLYNSVLSDTFGNTEKFSLLKVENHFDDFIDIDQDNILLKILLIPSREYYKFERKYDNLIGELASIGGVMDIIFGIGFIFVFIFAKENFNEAMVQEFYDLNDANFENLTKQNFDDVIAYFYNFHRDKSFSNYYYKDYSDNGFEKIENIKNGN